MQTVAETRETPMQRYDEKFQRVDKRFDDVDREFQRVDKRFDDVDREFKRVDKRFDDVNRRISEGREEAKQRFDRVEGDLHQLREFGIPDLKGELKGDIREVKEEIREVRTGLAALQDAFNRLVLGAATSWVILMVTILVKGG